MDPAEIPSQFEAGWLNRYVSQGLRDGTLRPGQRLGSERELAALFRTSRAALRRALVPLEREGLIRRVAGRAGGTFVGDFTLERDLSTIVSVAEYLQKQGLEAGTRVLSTAIIEADDLTADALGISPRSFVIELVRVRSANGVPIVLEHSCLPASRFPGLLELPLGGSVLRLLKEHYGLIPGEVTETIAAVNAGPDEARVLAVDPGAALMAVTRTAESQQGFFYEYSQDLFRGDHTRVVVRAPGGPGEESLDGQPGRSADVRVIPPLDSEH
jgi:GntR family transcriptional regulator